MHSVTLTYAVRVKVTVERVIDQEVNIFVVERAIFSQFVVNVCLHCR